MTLHGRMRLLACIMLVIFAFTKVYQHNLMIKASYQKQRLERKRYTLEKERNDLFAQLATLQSPEYVALQVQKKQGMQPLSVEQLIIPMQEQVFDMTVTSTGSYKHALLQKELMLLVEAGHVNT